MNILNLKQKTFSSIIVLFCFAGILVAAAKPLHSENLRELLVPLLKTHNLVKGSEASLTAAKERVKESRGAWFPTATITSHYARERQNKTSGTDDSLLWARNASVSVNQLVWDFGAANATINTTKLGARSADHTLESTKQDLILRAVTAYLNVDRTARALKFARDSEINIKRQTELENSLVKRGAGLSSDVLQAKVTLAGAQARRASMEGALAVARNAYRSVFHTDTANLAALKKPILSGDLIPSTVEEAIQTALQENPKIRAVNLSVAMAQEAINATKASSFYPKFDITASATYKHNDGGAIGHQEDGLAKLSMTFPFNLGFTAINTLKAVKSDALAANSQVGETRDMIEQLVRDTWANMNTSKITYKFMANQAVISAEFLELARKERKAGNKTLLDVLTGETGLINAQADATSAETDVLISTFTLLNAMGRLTLNVIP